MSPDSDIYFNVNPQSVMGVSSAQDSVQHIGYGFAEERISFSDSQKYYFDLQFDMMSSDDFDYIGEFFSNTLKAYGNVKTFLYQPNIDEFNNENIYVVRFLEPNINGFFRNVNIFGIGGFRLKILGKYVV